MPALVEPVPPATARLLRQAVLALATSEHRRHFPATLHLGTPGGEAVTVVDDPDWDAGLRADIAGSALRATLRWPLPTAPKSAPTGTVAWVTRPGGLSLQDVDASWLGPLLRSADECGVDLVYVVVTRHGWVDPRTGAHREWRRIRDRRA